MLFTSRPVICCIATRPNTPVISALLQSRHLESGIGLTAKRRFAPPTVHGGDVFLKPKASVVPRSRDRVVTCLKAGRVSLLSPGFCARRNFAPINLPSKPPSNDGKLRGQKYRSGIRTRSPGNMGTFDDIGYSFMPFSPCRWMRTVDLLARYVAPPANAVALMTLRPLR